MKRAAKVRERGMSKGVAWWCREWKGEILKMGRQKWWVSGGGRE